jgi:hypothetical protein
VHSGDERDGRRRTPVEVGTSQGQISRIERQSDLLVSTLSAYLTALGVEASLVCRWAGRPSHKN